MVNLKKLCSQKNYIKLDYFFIFIIVSAYCLHLLRNISSFYAVVPIVFSFIFASICLVKKAKFNLAGSIVLFAFFLSYLFPILYSFFFYPSENYIVSIIRYLYLIPFAMFCVFCVQTTEEFIYTLKLFSFFIVLGGLTLFFQLKFGAIPWFADASEREGLIRFSSLVGSLTSYGVFSVLALPVVYFLINNKILRIFLLLLISIAMLTTLQKAAVVNIVLFFGSSIFFHKFKKKIKVVSTFVIFVFVFVSISYYLKFSYVIATIDNVFRFREAATVTDVNISDAIVHRLWMLPSKLYELHGTYGTLFGVGMVGGSGTLGFPEYPMAHNGFFDLLFIGGVLNVFAFAFFCLFIITRLLILKNSCFYMKRSYKLINCLVWIYFLFLINMFFYGPLHMHPYGGLVFYSISVFTCLRFGELRDYVINNNI